MDLSRNQESLSDALHSQIQMWEEEEKLHIWQKLLEPRFPPKDRTKPCNSWRFSYAEVITKEVCLAGRGGVKGLSGVQAVSMSDITGQWLNQTSHFPKAKHLFTSLHTCQVCPAEATVSKWGSANIIAQLTERNTGDLDITTLLSVTCTFSSVPFHEKKKSSIGR